MHRGEAVIEWSPKGGNLVLEDGRGIKIVWSNNYAPLDCFILVDSSATRWIVKRDMLTGDRLTAMYVRNDNDPSKVDLYVRTVVNAELVDPKGVKAFRFEKGN
jgi:hypothetical protein